MPVLEQIFTLTTGVSKNMVKGEASHTRKIETQIKNSLLYCGQDMKCTDFTFNTP